MGVCSGGLLSQRNSRGSRDFSRSGICARSVILSEPGETASGGTLPLGRVDGTGMLYRLTPT